MRVSLIQIIPGPAAGSLYASDTEGRLWLYGPPETAGAHTLSGGRPAANYEWRQILTPEDPGDADQLPGLQPKETNIAEY